MVETMIPATSAQKNLPGCLNAIEDANDRAATIASLVSLRRESLPVQEVPHA